ncbi:hypothetical protein TVAG_313650 [Trichomonas vaginalis G3]|uniref:Uncharacterized protein n=1 Tax=Trichomonas vaginalis (strain ATCC PRA-98 / G3) TaxID=412133 RepID=A2G6M6_TRIV3|nr:hypothetical protein TVAGG3_0396510 [Trichomonas vaginalis G3]EAX87192.1 hypothetical protein TVAG_313650 [Trichomonas vaginalis G3]KAI5534378.1 hypothetical protein TVAGG3_0396510 [Trichomonas vaginalis G3]|eukprot:XP_001300122.1 hypothetical protein [Trichomonas vaginalis G3]
MNETRNQKIQRLKQIREEFNGISHSLANGTGIPRLKIEHEADIEPLTINSDVKKYIDQINRTLVLDEPKVHRNAYQKQLIASSARIKRINNGYSIVNSIKSPRILMKKQYSTSVPFVSEKESITPESPHFIPDLGPKATFILPQEIVEDSLSSKKSNDLNKLEYKIKEDERRLLNDFANKMNVRETHREEIMKQRHKDFIQFGFEESNRRANRAQKIFEIRYLRENDWEWWSPLLDTFQTSTPGIYDLECLEDLSKLNELTEYNISKVFKKGAKKSPNAKEVYRKTLRLANEFGHFLSPAKLNLAFKTIDDKL